MLKKLTVFGYRAQIFRTKEVMAFSCRLESSELRLGAIQTGNRGKELNWKQIELSIGGAIKN